MRCQRRRSLTSALHRDALCVRAGLAGCWAAQVKAASTLGTFLRSFRWGHVRQIDAVSRPHAPRLCRDWCSRDCAWLGESRGMNAGHAFTVT